MRYGIEGTRVVAYTYDAAIHCTEHALERFGRTPEGWVPEDVTDAEGNPVHAIFTSDLDLRTVEECGTDQSEIICLCCGVVSATRAIGAACWNCQTAWNINDEE